MECLLNNENNKKEAHLIYTTQCFLILEFILQFLISFDTAILYQTNGTGLEQQSDNSFIPQ
ncbi:hypothetical protein [Microcoleus sp. MON2_D5]|jgi:hypothetical protein|uniref:hypothetical protein n=1 Tax=Microcoleus sp. MON2_D5 TaxID=2818833 RepID=UPI002FD38BA8